MPIIDEIQDRLRLAFPKSADLAISRAVQEGSYLADNLFDGESFLNNQVGRDLRGHVRRIGIAYQINHYCERGDLPFITSMKPMPKGNWHWLEIVATGAVAHICRTDDVFKFPDEADSRQDFRLTIQKDLLSWSDKDKPFSQIIREIPKLYAWLTFRIAQDGRISHLCWAAPAADFDEWVGHINILQEIERSGSEAPAASLVADPKDKLRLKDHIAQALGKSDSKIVGE